MFKHLVNKPSVEKVSKIIQNAVEIEQVGGQRAAGSPPHSVAGETGLTGLWLVPLRSS